MRNGDVTKGQTHSGLNIYTTHTNTSTECDNVSGIVLITNSNFFSYFTHLLLSSKRFTCPNTFNRNLNPFCLNSRPFARKVTSVKTKVICQKSIQFNGIRSLIKNLLIICYNWCWLKFPIMQCSYIVECRTSRRLRCSSNSQESRALRRVIYK